MDQCRRVAVAIFVALAAAAALVQPDQGSMAEQVSSLTSLELLLNMAQAVLVEITMDLERLAAALLSVQMPWQIAVVAAQIPVAQMAQTADRVLSLSPTHCHQLSVLHRSLEPLKSDRR